MHQALIAITLIAVQAYLEESRITSVVDLMPQQEGVITAEDLAKEVAGLNGSEGLVGIPAEESMEDLMPDGVVANGEITKTGEEVEKAKAPTTGLEIIVPETEVAKKEEVKKEEEKVETVKAEGGVKEGEEKVAEVKKTEEKVAEVKKTEEKAKETKEVAEKVVTEGEKKVAEVVKVEEKPKKETKEVEVAEVKKPEVVGTEEVSIKTLLIKPEKVMFEREDGEGEKLDIEQKKALATALEISAKEADIIFLTDEEKLELLLEARDEMLEAKEKEFVIIPREKRSQKFVQEYVPKALITTERSLDNRHIPLVLSDDDLIEIAFDAIQENDSVKFRSIVKDLKNPNIIHEQSGETALTYATRYKSYAIMKFLIYYGADLNIGNYKSNSPLHIAVNNHDEYALGLLLEGSADVNAGNADEKTPLMLAIETNQPNMVKTLVHYGSDLEAVDSKGLTAMDIARKYKNTNVEKFLIKTISEQEVLSARK